MQKKRIYDILLIIGLLGAFGFLGWSIWKNNRPEKAAEIKILPETVRAAGSSVETAQTEDGQQVATFLSYPKYYQDEGKVWQAVETDIVKNEAGDIKLPSGTKADWKVDKGVWKFYATNDGAVAADNAGIKLETKLKSLVYFDSETKKTSTIYSRDTQQVVAQPIVAQNQIIWPNIIDGVDYKITYINDLMKEEIVMSDAARQKLPTPESLGIPSDRAYLGFLFDRSKEQVGGLKAFAVDSQSEALGRREVEYGTKGFETEGNIEFVNEKGNKVQTIESGFTSLNAPESVVTGPLQSGDGRSGPVTTGQDLKRLPLLKRFYKERPGEVNGKKFLFSGSKYADIQNLGSGDLLFDPTVSFQKGDGGSYSEVDDTYTAGGSNAITGAYEAFYTSNSPHKSLVKFPQFIGLASGQVPAGSTIGQAYLTLTTYDFSGYGSVATANIYKVLDQWTEGNCFSCSTYSAGNFGATDDKAQDKYNTETAYINDGDGITATETSVVVDNGSGGNITVSDWPPQGIIKIDSEIMSYTGVTATGFTGLTHGVSGTTAATHSNNAVVDGSITWVEAGGAAGPAGGSVSGSSYASFVPTTINTPYTADIKTLVQEWVNDPVNNYGLMIYINDPDTAVFYSSEYTTVSKRPKLTVLYAEPGSGQAGLVNAYESNDASVSPSSPGTATTLQKMEYATEAEDSGFWTTALSTTDNGYDSQVFKMQVPSASATVPITVNWKGHGESAATNNNVSLNIWNFDSSAWEELDSGAARYNDTFTDKTSALNTAASWSTYDVRAMTFDTTNNKIYLGGGTTFNKKFARYDPAGDSFTNLSSKASYAIYSLVFDSANKEIYMGENGSGGTTILDKYNPVTDAVTNLDSKFSSFWGSNYVYALAFDSARNMIYLGGSGGKFAKYDPATGVATDLTSALNAAASWSTNEVYALAFDSANKTIYIGGASGKFAKYDPATDTVTDLTATLGWSGATYTIRTLTFDSNDNAIYAGGSQSASPKFAKYIPALNTVESLDGYLPVTMGSRLQYAFSYDPSNKAIYLAGSGAGITRYFPETLSSQSLTNSVYDAFGNIQLNATTFDTTNGALYVGGVSGKFGKYAVPSNTTLTGTVTSDIENYRDSSGYAWLWVKATNEWSPPSVSSIAGGPTVTWTSGEGADGAIVYRSTIYASGASWNDYNCGSGSTYCGIIYETDAGWKTSHSITTGGNTCDQAYYYRVRSCDSWGSCTVSAEYSYTNAACGGSCPFLFSWDGEKYDFQTDIISSGKMGLPAGKDGRRKPNADDYYFLKDETLEAEGGRYKFKLTEERDEMDYLDNLKLYYVDHAPNLEVYTDQIRIGQERKSLAPAIYTVDKTALKKPVSCTDYYGNDCLEKITVADNDYTAPGQLYRWDTMEMDLGDLRDSENIKLVLRSFQAVAGTFDNQPAYDKNIHGPMPDVSFKLEVKNEAGEWQNIDVKNLSLSPTEFPRTYVADLTGVFLTDDYRMRLSYYNDTRFDYVAIDTSEDIPVELREVELEKAELGNRLAVSQKNMEIGPYEPQYEQEIEDNKRLAFSGNFTKYGDIKELLDSKDDRFLIFQKPDELDIEFQSDPNLSEGLERDFLLYSSGFYKVAKYGIAPTVDPLPFNAMSNYPYPEAEYPYKDDADYQDYLDTWNTRRVEKGQKAKDFDETVPGQLENIFEKGKNILEDLLSLDIFGDPIRNNDNGISNGASYTMHAENSNGSADTDFIEMSVDSETRLKGGVTLPGGVRLK